MLNFFFFELPQFGLYLNSYLFLQFLYVVTFYRAAPVPQYPAGKIPQRHLQSLMEKESMLMLICDIIHQSNLDQ